MEPQNIETIPQNKNKFGELVQISAGCPGLGCQIIFLCVHVFLVYIEFPLILCRVVWFPVCVL